MKRLPPLRRVLILIMLVFGGLVLCCVGVLALIRFYPQIGRIHFEPIQARMPLAGTAYTLVYTQDSGDTIHLALVDSSTQSTYPLVDSDLSFGTPGYALVQQVESFLLVETAGTGNAGGY